MTGLKRRGAFGFVAFHQGAHHCQESVDPMPVGPEQDTAFEWLTWCQQHGETVVDPLNQKSADAGRTFAYVGERTRWSVRTCAKWHERGSWCPMSPF